MHVFAFKIVDTFTVNRRGNVFIADQRELLTPLRVGDSIELRGMDAPIQTKIIAVEAMRGPSPDRTVLGIMVPLEVSREAMKTNPQVWLFASK